MVPEPPPIQPPAPGPRYRVAARPPRRPPYPTALLALTGVLGVLMGVLLWQVVGAGGGVHTSTVTKTVHVKNRTVAARARKAPQQRQAPASGTSGASKPSRQATTTTPGSGDGESAADLQVTPPAGSSGTGGCETQADGTLINCSTQGP